jgi:hypothetical protein
MLSLDVSNIAEIVTSLFQVGCQRRVFRQTLRAIVS